MFADISTARRSARTPLAVHTPWLLCSTTQQWSSHVLHLVRLSRRSSQPPLAEDGGVSTLRCSATDSPCSLRARRLTALEAVSQRLAWGTGRAWGLRKPSSPIFCGSEHGGGSRPVGHSRLNWLSLMDGCHRAFLVGQPSSRNSEGRLPSWWKRSRLRIAPRRNPARMNDDGTSLNFTQSHFMLVGLAKPLTVTT